MATMSILGLYQWDENILQPLKDALPSTVDPDAVEIEILSECAELEILYPDADSFKTILNAWCAGRKDVWKRMSDALSASYNIIENYDRSEEWTDTATGKSNSVNKAKGYQMTQPEMIPQTRNESDGDSSSTHKGRVHGNIGVRSAQELVEQELELAAKADLEDVIVKDFKGRFCLLVY